MRWWTRRAKQRVKWRGSVSATDGGWRLWAACSLPTIALPPTLAMAGAWIHDLKLTSLGAVQVVAWRCGSGTLYPYLPGCWQLSPGPINQYNVLTIRSWPPSLSGPRTTDPSVPLPVNFPEYRPPNLGQAVWTVPESGALRNEQLTHSVVTDASGSYNCCPKTREGATACNDRHPSSQKHRPVPQQHIWLVLQLAS